MRVRFVACGPGWEVESYAVVRPQDADPYEGVWWDATAAERAVLRSLASKGHHVVSRETLGDGYWGVQWGRPPTAWTRRHDPSTHWLLCGSGTLSIEREE